MDRNIILVLLAATAGLLMSVTTLKAQASGGQTVSGTVTDAQTNETLPGVTVSIPELHIGSITRGDGQYVIHNVPAGAHKVEAKLVGYKMTTQSVTVAEGHAATANFSLKVAPLEGKEVVVTGLTGEVNRKELGNSIGEVPGLAISTNPSPNAIDAISGRVPGALVTRSSGSPGAGTYMILRGRKTISGSSEPLYIVDGTVIDNSSLIDNHQNNGDIQLSNRVVDINPNDIESVEVLRGPSAAAIYGALAANGVVLITTKRGRVTDDLSKASITFSSNYEFDQKASGFPLQTTYGQTTPYVPGTNGQPGTPGSTTSWGALLPAGTPVYNQGDVPFQNANSYVNAITITGGVPTFSYLINGSLENLGGTVINSSLDRRNLRLNLFAQVIPDLDIQSNSNYISSDNQLPQEGSNRSGILLGGLRSPPEFNNADYLEPDGSQRRYAGYDNPVWSENNNSFDSKIERFIHSTDAKYRPLSWLTLDGRVGLDRYHYDNFERLAVGAAISNSGQGGIEDELITSNNINADFTATGQWHLTDDLLTTVVLGSQTIWTSGSFQDVASTQTLPFFNQLSAGSQQTANSTISETKLVGQFVQATASFMDRYTLTAALRRDNSSVFGGNGVYHYYPHFGFAYSISDEPFWSGLKSTVNSMKLRASFGEGGSASLPYAYQTNFQYTTYGFNDPWGRTPISADRGGFTGIRQGGGTDGSFVLAGNADLQPELNIEREIGADLGFFDDRFTVGFTFYHQSIFDMIINLPVAGSTGFDQQPENVGSMWNEGIEWAIGVTPLQMENFTWTSVFNYARNYNLVTSLDVKAGGAIDIPGGFTGMNNSAIVGRPLGIFHGIGWLRDASGHIMYSYYDPTTKTVIGDDYGNNYVGAPRTATDPQIIGDPNPAFTISWRNDFNIMRDLSISVLLDGMYGQDVWNGTKGALYNFGTAADTKDRDQQWFNYDGQPVMDYTDPANPKPVTRQLYYQEYANGFDIDEPNVEKGSYLKLREITISYIWRGLQDWHINAVTFTASARNLKTWTNYTGYDPEVNTFAQSDARGYDYFTLPQLTSYRFGITLNY